MKNKLSYRKKNHWNNPWIIWSLLIFLLITNPIVAIIQYFFSGNETEWSHLVENLLSSYFHDTFILLLGVTIGTAALGIGLAWIVSAYDFWGRRYFEWLLILPIAFPAYMMAYSYVGFLEYTGPLSSFLRNHLNISFTGPLIDIMNIKGAIFVLTVSLYPYVYVLCRSSFLSRSQDLQEAAMLLGYNRWQYFFKIALPIARPAIVGGVALAAMEVLNDYGTVKYFGVDSFTVGIFRSWFSLGDIHSAIRLSLILLLFILILLWLENFQRGNRQWLSRKNSHPAKRLSLKGWENIGAIFICVSSLLLCFGFPLYQVIYWVGLTWQKVLQADFLLIIWRSFYLSASTALFVCLLAIVLLYTLRITPLKWLKYLSRISSLGYAVPGAIIAIGISISVISFDQWIINNWFSKNGLLLSGTIFMLFFAYTVRFLAVGYNSIESGFEKIGQHINEAGRLLGLSPFQALLRIDLPLLTRSLAAAMLLVFVDVLKELPLTLILRPFNFHTLATKAFDMATNEMVAESANASLIVVLTGVLPVILLNKIISKNG